MRCWRHVGLHLQPKVGPQHGPALYVSAIDRSRIGRPDAHRRTHPIAPTPQKLFDGGQVEPGHHAVARRRLTSRRRACERSRELDAVVWPLY
jgi:hypothetical protein